MNRPEEELRSLKRQSVKNRLFLHLVPRHSDVEVLF